MPSYSDIPPPMPNMDMATMLVQKYNDLPYPKGWLSSAGCLARFNPRSSSTPFPVSTMEWIPSEIMAEEPVMAAAMNLTTAMARFPMMAATIAIREPLCVVVGYHHILCACIKKWIF
ncbi:MAG: hypothetical protein A4E30_00606 [Methanomassiliicoccales archaeon PtaB.Bin215]|nr:MAG: hypothetical protein A4E30_00606 [Methanomassiliicoccales archaeon PtaB.Bin215]